MSHRLPTVNSLQRLRLFVDTCLRLPKTQLVRRVLHEAWHPATPPLAPAAMRGMTGIAAPITRPRALGEDGTFTFLNQPGRCDSPEAWQDRSHGLLWTYNLHYFTDLLSDGAHARQLQHVALMERWRVQNPAAYGVGWTPYPCSLRISNWIKWHYWLGPLSDDLVRSLAQQAAWLYRRCEYHHRGNHLFVNAKALCMAGLAVDTHAAKRWLQRGVSILRVEVPAQILSDGGHCERSPMYHALILEDVLDLLNVALRSDMPSARQIIALLQPRVAQMLQWLRAMSHPDGEIAFFNDAAFGIAPTLAQLEAYADRVLGANHRKSPPAGSVSLSESGFVRMARGNWILIADVGPVGAPEQPAHAHADSLSIEVSYRHQRVFVNSGISTYAAGPDRAYERGTASHNCVEVDGIDSSEVWSSFRVARRAGVTTEAADLVAATACLRASHDGYTRLRGRPVVHREIRLSTDELSIRDSVSSRESGAISRLHLHPDVRVEAPTDPRQLVLHLPDATRLVLHHNSFRAVTVPGFWRPEFGRKIANVCLEFEVPSDDLLIRVGTHGSSIFAGMSDRELDPRGDSR
jgi:uncharacterized heparinase superfamily protein